MKVAADFLTLPREGERLSGDAAFVRRGDDAVLIAVVDALGHGPIAAEVAVTATAYLGEAPLHRGVSTIVEGLHARLRGSRGAAAMVLVLSKGRLEGCGVGNVELRSVGRRLPVILTPGVLGGSLGKLRLFEGQLSAGDRLVVFSDGVSGRFGDDLAHGLPAPETCRAIMSRYRRPYDDATVLVTDIEVQ